MSDCNDFKPLVAPIPLSDQKWPEGTKPFVTTRTVTFMHEKTIRNCLDGILMQRTTFPVKICIHDDASEDKTTSILREYAGRYPQLIKVFYQQVNTYLDTRKTELRAEYMRWIYEGKYIAFCEGDDYWTEPFKLQRQVDYMDANEGCAGCFHNGTIHFTNNNSKQIFLEFDGTLKGDSYRKIPKDILFTTDLVSPYTFVPTASFLYRAIYHPPEYYDSAWRKQSASDDICMFSMLTKGGKFLKYLDFDGFVYRKHSGGVSSAHNPWFIYRNRKISYENLSKFHNDKYKNEFHDLIRQHRAIGFRWMHENWSTINDSQVHELAGDLGVSNATKRSAIRVHLEHELKIQLLKEGSLVSSDFDLLSLQQMSAASSAAPHFRGVFLEIGGGMTPYKKFLKASGNDIERYITLAPDCDGDQADVDVRWDGQRIPLEDASIDSAMATEVLEHCPDPLVVLREIRRVLKPGGAFFFTVPYIWPLHDAPWDFYRYTPFSLKNLLKEAGFEDLNIRALSGWDASLAQMMGLWMKRAPMSPERRNTMAQKLWPIYQELIESDELPSDPEAGNTMATGWSGLVYAAAESVALPSAPSPEVAAIDLPVVIVRSHAHNYSETFIEDHVQYISNQATVLYGWPFPRFIEGDRSVLGATVEKQLVQALRSGKAIGKELQAAYWDGLAKFFKARGVRVALLESGLMGAMVSEACVRAELPHMVHFHGVDAFAYKLLEQWQAHYQRFFRTAAAVVGVSQEMVQQLSTLGAADERLVHAPYGVSTELEAYAQPLDAQPVFLSVGRFVAKKAPHKTLQAFEAVYQKVPAARLIMVGEGPMLKKCKAWVHQQGIQDAVTFAGVQSRRSVSRLMAHARVFVQHSVVAEDGDHEGLPLAILEAGAHGLPVVATRHAGIPDAVREETDGFLVDEGDVQAMAVAMYRLAQDAALAAHMGAAYQQRVRSDYSRAVSIARLQKLLQATADTGYRKPTDVQTAQNQQKASMLSPKPIANVEELKSAIANENDAGTCLQLAQRASELGDETVAYECYERAVSLDRSCGPAYLEMGKRLGQAAQYADAYLCLKEAERAGQLDASSQQLLQALAANPDLQTDSVLQYQQRRQVFDGQLTNQPRRILIFTNLLPPQEMGGYGRSIWELCEGLLLRGHTVSILTADVPELQQKAYAGYERVERHVQRNLQLFGGWSQGGAQAIDDVEQIKKIALHNVKVVLHQVSTFQPDVCMVGNLDFLGSGMLDPILKHGVPVLHRLGNGMPGYSAEMTPQSPLYCIAGCSEWVNSELETNGFNAHNFALLPPGSPLHEYYRFVPPNYDQLRICFAGLMMAYKGPHLILEALDYLKKLKIPFSCEFAGDFKDPAFEQQFKQRIRQYQLEDSIRLLGFCDREQLRAMFDRSNVLVMPSVFEEPFGKVQIEAQAAGLAVVRSPVGGYKDMIEDGVNGLLFKSEDAKDLARQLFVLRGDLGLWSRIALQGQHDAFRFETQASVETLEALFEGLITKRMTAQFSGV